MFVGHQERIKNKTDTATLLRGKKEVIHETVIKLYLIDSHWLLKRIYISVLSVLNYTENFKTT